MKPWKAITTGLGKYAIFEGRARRSEYYWFIGFYLFSVLVVYFAYQWVVDYELARKEAEGQELTAAVEAGMTNGLYFFLGAQALFFLLPLWSVTVRRLHDTGRSGWWSLLALVTAGLAPFLMALQDSQPGSNPWGFSPKEEPVTRVRREPQAVS